MKKALVVVLWMAVMIGCGDGNGKGGSIVSLVGPSDVDAKTLSSSGGEELSGTATLAFSASSIARSGEEFTVDVRVDNASIFGAAYRVKFSATHLQFVRIEEGDFLKKDGAQTSLMSALRSDELVVGQTRLGHVLNVSGSGAIAKITFKALSAGNTDIQFSDVSLKEQFIGNGEYLLRSIIFEAQDTVVNIK